MSSVSLIPSYNDLLWPTLRAVREIGDSGTIEEIVEQVIELEGFTDGQQGVLHGEGPSTEIEYRLAWARTYLKGMGALNNSERGVWSTTELGRTMTPEDVVTRHAAYKARPRRQGPADYYRQLHRRCQAGGDARRRPARRSHRWRATV
jgi:restriction system protein